MPTLTYCLCIICFNLVLQKKLRSCLAEASFVSMYFEPVITKTAHLKHTFALAPVLSMLLLLGGDVCNLGPMY